jgi:molecular chaperone DnaJ
MHVEDIFSMFNDIFGRQAGGGGAARPRARLRPRDRGRDRASRTPFNGCEREVEFKRARCVRAPARAAARSPARSPRSCPTCGGHGQVAQAGFGGMFRMVTTCPDCRGRGTVITDKCEKCRGQGRVSTKRKLARARSRPASLTGQVIRAVGRGRAAAAPRRAPKARARAATSMSVVRVAEHERFERRGADLVAEQPMAFAQAALGATSSRSPASTPN